jgi:hypothetical protein
VRLLLDENFNNNILRGLLQRRPDLDVIRAQDVPEIAGQDDPTVLAWTAEQGRILLTHDVRTITKYAYERVIAGEPMPGVVEVKRLAALAKVIDDILMLVEAGQPEDVENHVICSSL